MLLAVGGLPGCRQSDDATAERVVTVPDFYTELRSMHRMSFASMKLTKTVTTDRTKWYKVGKRVGVYSYDVWIEGCVDLSELTPYDVVVDTLARRVSVTLSQPTLEIKGRSPELRVEYEHIDLFRSRPDSKERAELKEIADRDLQRELKSNSQIRDALLQTARRKGAAYVESVIEAAGYIPDVRFAGSSALNVGPREMTGE